jgi:hypothetical protein
MENGALVRDGRPAGLLEDAQIGRRERTDGHELALDAHAIGGRHDIWTHTCEASDGFVHDGE